MARHYLDRLFAPNAIAVFGAGESPASVGGRIYMNLRDGGFPGALYPINPKRQRIFDRECHASLADIQAEIDLAVIVTPARTVPEIIQSCGEHGIRMAVVISAGFGAGDDQGSELCRRVQALARQYRMRILGPNCLGLIRTGSRMNATFSKNNALPGHLALISQSGALCTSILDWAVTRNIGFSTLISLGDALDIDFGELLDYLAQDPETVSILLYVEGIRNARGFISGLRVAARMKPVVVVKAGRHQEGSRAAVTHTGALVGADDVFDAALQRAGVVRATTIGQLFSAAGVLAAGYRARGNRLAIITNGGGLGVMATDRAVDLGVTLADLAPVTLETLNRNLPAHWSHANPIDLLGDAPPGRYAAAIDACLADNGIDGILAMLSPQAMTDPEACAQAVIEAAAESSKPILCCWMGDQQVAAGRNRFIASRIPHFHSPEASVEAFAHLANHHHNQQLLMQVPGPLAERSEPDIEGARLIIESALAERRTLLSPTEARAVLHAFRIPAVPGVACASANEALVAAQSIGFPVAMKINSPDISHKSDVGGVKLNIRNAQAVRACYHDLIEAVKAKSADLRIAGVIVEPMQSPAHSRELLIGVVRDPVFGPAITFGAGGITAEAMQDRAVALPPLNDFLIENMIRRTRVARLLGPFRNLPAIDMNALIEMLRRVSEMVCELPALVEMDLNPVIAHAGGVMALDARLVVAHVPSTLEPYAHMAIHPYPGHLVSRLQLADGTDIVIRPIRPEDATIEKSFVHNLSADSKYFRFMQGLNELTQDMLIRFTQLDYHRELALIAVFSDQGQEREVGVARYVMNPDGASCEFALVVADAWQGKGIGSKLMTDLMGAAAKRGLSKIVGEVLATNVKMLMLMRSLGFTVTPAADEPAICEVSRTL
ncbi:MAG: GNAT family N-acetyltransferase [Gammaproteobacteria bacterium]|nr:MAG: GNAT family N-acetyltransferase [Gammaproteobacteria bacterium]